MEYLARANLKRMPSLPYCLEDKDYNIIIQHTTCTVHNFSLRQCSFWISHKESINSPCIMIVSLTAYMFIEVCKQETVQFRYYNKLHIFLMLPGNQVINMIN